MPTYEYACKKCDEHLEVVQSFKDDALTKCPNCGGELRKVFGNVGIVFKGSGFYKTDSRPAGKSSSSTTDDKKGDTKGEPAKSETKSSETKSTETKTESKPAKKAEAKTA